MQHVHFDPEAIARAARDLADKNRGLALAEARAELDRAYVIAQHAMSRAAAEALSQTVRLKNDGRSDAFVGSVVGSFVGSVIVNVVANSADPEACLDHINSTVVKAMRNGLVARDDSFTSAGHVEIHGERGGRA